MTADYAQIRTVAERLAGRLRGAEWVRVTSPAGSRYTPRARWRRGVAHADINAF
jgi:hypothetical protein